MKKFSAALTYLRKREGMNQQELADKIGLTRSTVAMYESGQRMPSFEAIAAIASTFGVSADFLFGRVDSGDYSTIFREKLAHVYSTSSIADLTACGISVSELEFIINGTVPLTFDYACELCDKIGVSLDFMIEAEESATLMDDGLSEITKTFTLLSPDNRSKLLELSRLYLSAQSSNEERQ